MDDIKYEIEILRKLVAVPTVSGDEEAYAKMEKLLVGELRGLGARVSVVDPKRDGASKSSWPNVIADFDFSSRHTICINCHYDVVPPGSGWKQNPFELVEHDGKLIGRGTCDDKGSIALSMGVLKSLMADRSSLYNIRLILTCDEEIGSEHGVEYVLKKGLGRGIEFALVLDGSMNPVIGCSGGVEGTITVYGRQAHAGAEWKGDNAISNAVRLLAELEKFKMVRARRISVLEMPDKDAPRKNVFGRFNITMLKAGARPNIIPGACEAAFDMRLLPEERPAKAIDELRSYLNKAGRKLGVKASLKIDDVLEGYIANRNNNYVKSFINACGERNGYGTWGVVDGRLFARKGIPAVAYGPSNSGMDHSANEYIGREEMKRAKSVLLKFLSGRK